MSDVNPFGDLEDDFQKVAAAEAAAMPGRIPEATYKFVCTVKELKDDGVLVDHEAFATPKGTKGFRLFAEVLEPESVMNKSGEAEPTKGKVLECVFWITVASMPFVKRDLATILGRPFAQNEKLGDVCMNTVWAGRTFEGVIRDEVYGGRTSSRVGFYNPWAPPADGSEGVVKAAETKKIEPAKTTTPTKGAAPAKGTTPAKTSGARTF